LKVETATTLNTINRDAHLSDDAVRTQCRGLHLWSPFALQCAEYDLFHLQFVQMHANCVFKASIVADRSIGESAVY